MPVQGDKVTFDIWKKNLKLNPFNFPSKLNFQKL